MGPEVFKIPAADDVAVQGTEETKSPRHAVWLAWTRDHLGDDPVRAEAAATAADRVLTEGRSFEAAYEAARAAWRSTPASATKSPGSAAPTTRAWRIALGSLAVAYVSFPACLWLASQLLPAEYQHSNDLLIGGIAITWSLVALGSYVLSTNGFRRVFAGRARPNLILLLLNVPILLGLAIGLLVGGVSLYMYWAGIAAYDKSFRDCGHPPLLASHGWGDDDVIGPKDSEYERLKYSTQDLTLSSDTYFCTLSDAEAHGYRRASWHENPPV